MKKITILLVAIATSVALTAQDKTEFTLTLKDGNVVTGTTGVKEITLITSYGKLEIPIKNVSSITLGIHPAESERKKIESLVKQLHTSNEEMRESAYKSIIELPMGAVPVLEELSYSGTYLAAEFTDYTLSNAINELKVVHNVAPDYSTEDVVSIDYIYNMGGKYSFNSVELKTEYGTLNIPRTKINKIDVMFYDASQAGMKTFKLFANKHISGNNDGGWLKTGIMVKNGQSLDFLASGEVTLASLSGNKYKPDGAYKNTTSNDYTPSVSTSTYPTYGNTIYKIGENGTNIKIGANYKGRASSSGMLYLSIYETVYNASNTGFYVIKLKVK